MTSSPSPTGLFEPAPYSVDKDGWVWLDGNGFPAGTSELTASLFMCFQGEEKGPGRARVPLTREDRFRYLRRAIDLAFNVPGSIRRVVWNEWTEDILRDCITEKGEKNFVGFAGCSSSGKSDAVALYGLMGYWARPADTFFIVMSTTKQDARMRVWKSVTQLWGQATLMGCPGKLIDSDGYIKGVDANGKLWRNSGIVLKAAGKADGEEASKELLGIKNPHVIVGADEKNELHPGILKTASENLISNETLTFCGMANPDKLTDPFGDLCEPEDGWKSINETQTTWRTKFGKCRRFNAEDSPRIKHPEMVDSKGRHLLYWQPDQAYCDRIAGQRGGKKSRGYYRFVKAFWCPDGSANSIYSEVEFMNSSALDQNEPMWDEYPVMLTSLDPSFSRGGDRSQGAFGKLGKVNGRDHLHVCLETTIEDDITDKTTPLSYQVIHKWRDLGAQWGVKP